MASLYEVVFLLCFIFMVGITLSKVYNVMNAGEWYSIKISWVLLIGYILVWGVALITMMVDRGSELLFSILMQMGNILLVMNFVLLVFEMFFTMRDESLSPVRARNSREARKDE